MKVILLLLPLAGLLACSHTPPSNTSSADPVAKAPVEESAPESVSEATEVTEAKAETVKLTLNPLELVYDEEAGLCVYTPGGLMKQPGYTIYSLDLASLEAVLGERPLEPVDVLVELGPPETKTVQLEPEMPQPDGGFQNTYFSGKVVGAP